MAFKTQTDVFQKEIVDNKQKWPNAKKILIVANSSWNIYNFRLNVLDQLLAENFEIVVLAPIDAYSRYKNDYPSVTHVPLRQLERRGVNPFQEMRLFREMERIIGQIKPDLLLFYTIKPNIYGGFIAQKLGTPYVGCITGLGFTFLNGGIIQKIMERLYRFAFAKAKAVIFENIDDRLLFDEHGIVVANKSISVKGCGIDIHKYRPQERTYAPVHGNLIFTYIGRFLYDKGIVEFAKAAKIVKNTYPNTEFWLVGEIDTGNPSALKQKELDDWIADGLVINFGQTDDVRPYIADSDCVVCPSYREAIPRVLQEAMSMSRPIISTDVAGCREAVDHFENGLLVPSKNEKALAEAMLTLIEMPKTQRHNMGRKGRLKVLKEFDQELIAHQIVHTLLSAMPSE
jgi:glycosyltransferase involved in cell wall biosynthesis